MKKEKILTDEQILEMMEKREAENEAFRKILEKLHKSPKKSKK